MKPAGRTFIISGGCSGLGLATARDLHQAGAYVALLDVNADAGSAVIQELGEQRAKFLQADVTDTSSLEAAVNSTVEWIKQTGSVLAGVVAAAGVGLPAKIYDARTESPVEMSSIDFVLNINIRGSIDLIRLSVPHMVKNTPLTEDGERGVIIMVSSAAAFDGQPGQVAYAASKGAVASMTLPLARDLARYGIRAVTIAPSLFDSAMTRQLSDKARKSLERVMEFPVRAGNPEEFSSLVMQSVTNSMLNGTCDEQRPACKNCLRHNIDCAYSVSPVKSRLLAQNPATQLSASSATPAESTVITTENGISSNTTSPSIVSAESDPLLILNPQRDGSLPADLHLRDLELMHHYCLEGYKSISQDDAFAQPFQKEVPKIALSHPFLMHGVLALSAVHLAYLNKNGDRVNEYDELAAGHQTLALALFRKELDNITPSNSAALFVFSSIATVLAFASPQITGMHSLSPIDEMLQISTLCRGIAEILQTSRGWLENSSDSWVTDMLSSKRRLSEMQPLPADIEAKLAPVYKLNADLTRTGLDIQEAVACEEAISELSRSFQQLNSGYHDLTVFRWPIVIRPVLFSLMRDRRPMALVVLGHFCILLHKVSDRWWVESWPRLLLQSIHDQLDVSWREHIRWPMEALGPLP
ncbi:C6 transcription factor [Talaromyces pinophilus]|uniref:C6 transcription factor n=1 Tax=Talaromyces pinophilus TaxID=128442 RepID=A0A6V8H1S2_TALPI|nr:C6 transcription factor [Talaromyces pinophilus]